MCTLKKQHHCIRCESNCVQVRGVCSLPPSSSIPLCGRGHNMCVKLESFVCLIYVFFWICLHFHVKTLWMFAQITFALQTTCMSARWAFGVLPGSLHLYYSTCSALILIMSTFFPFLWIHSFLLINIVESGEQNVIEWIFAYHKM